MNEQQKQVLYKIAAIIEERAKNFFLKKLAQAKLMEVFKIQKDLKNK